MTTGCGEAVNTTVERWNERHRSLAAAWQAVLVAEQTHEAAAVQAWTPRLSEMQRRQDDLVRRGQWRGGPRTLMAALNLHYRELSLTAGLAWLLSPDGHHGLGTAVLTEMLDHLGVDGAVNDPKLRIALEDSREETRADLVVYGAQWTIVVEAKTFAVEQERQLDRLHEHWQNDPGAAFVFLTRGQRAPLTARESRGKWKTMSWDDVGRFVRKAVQSVDGVTPGVLDYLNTLEAYHHV